jgi:hypothetical protein
MKRSLATWQKADPKAMAFEQSPVACMHALADMKADMMELAALLKMVIDPPKLTACGVECRILKAIPESEWQKWEESK